MKAVHFGAGNIGRGFIGLLLHNAGYEITFVDVNDKLVSELQDKGQYAVKLANEQGDTYLVDHITAIDGKDVDRVAEAIAGADIVTTAVGVNILKHIAGAIARGIEQRAIGKDGVRLATGGGSEQLSTDGGSEQLATDGSIERLANGGGSEQRATDGSIERLANGGGSEQLSTDNSIERHAIVRGSERRVTNDNAALPIIACENALGGSTLLKKLVYEQLDAAGQSFADQYIAFPDAAVDRIVPLQLHSDSLQVTVEPFYEWTVERSPLLASQTEIQGIHYVDRLEPYIERKLFTVNTGHCVAAYHGNLKGYATIQEAMQDPDVVAEVKGALLESGAALVRTYQFDEKAHADYVNQILERFINPYLVDEIARIGRSPIRKLSPNDRLVRPAISAYQYGIPVDHLTAAMAAALYFNYPDDPESVELQGYLNEHGLHATLVKYTGLAEQHPLHIRAAEQYHEISQRYSPAQKGMNS
ncbi:mannitol-1-phosphate/altronate dehydrogenase [Paenibacillus endophyticus]|uniref:Mannitol-1-phosphate 5-dehydrogenase n=1 Tax=Paenibacillus endophyticus TaxID=1294268 RepID=A0A7W5C8V6_9BACL|nr:mannitol-1-phosphate 5-dehydrogenase [Paenibacillus endophyticus]MBB3153273.1 mannitol-1-phosphate/altronate dehydrogenase [Paenibacillus endophyticus]